MRPLVIELVHEGIEAGLLLEDVRGRRPRGLGLQRQVKTLVPPILLGMPRRNSLQADAEAEPPDGELTQPVQRVRGGGLTSWFTLNRQAIQESDLRLRRRRVLFVPDEARSPRTRTVRFQA